MWIFAWTINHGQNALEDFFTIHSSEAAAVAAYGEALKKPDLHCAAVANITAATEPHWTEA